MSEKKLSIHDENVLNVKRGKQLERMAGHPGWTEVLKPFLESRRKAQMQILLNASGEKVIQSQQSIKEIDSLFMLITAQIALGKQAAEKLDTEKVDESE